MTLNKKINWKEEVPNLIALDKSGKSLSEISYVYEVSRQRICQIFKKFDISPTCWETRKKITGKASHRVWASREQDLYEIKKGKWRNKLYNAKQQHIEFNIPFSEIEWPTHCPILGIELNYESEGKSERSVSFDRVNSSKGYVSGNVKIISWRANRIKNDGTLEEHQAIVDYMTKAFVDDTITKQRSFNTVNKE